MSTKNEFPPEEPKSKISERFPDYVPPTKITYIGGRPVTLHLRKCRLQLKDGDEWGREFVSDKNVITVGSVDDNDLVVKDETVSRYHCKIIEDNQSYLLVDLNSTNGTFVNRVRVREAFLKPGSLVTLGKTEMRFQAMDEKVEIQPSAKEAFGGIIGRAEKIREIFGILEKISPTGVTVVIEGETGTGKEVVARAIHNNSPRKTKPFMVFDCGAVPENLIESELFGHEKGSFTGAVMTRQGLFEMANGGTIFLDELGELNLDLQPKLLRVLEQREVKRVGSNKSIPIDVRVIAATNRTLEKEVREGRFREDLFYRLSVVRLFMPPLRDRKEDIPLLVKHFLRTMTFNRDEAGKPRVTRVDRGAIEVMKNYDWPGNVRELLNVIERACSFSDEGIIAAENLPIQLTSGSQPRAKVAGGAGGARAQSPEEKLPFKEAKEKWVSSFERDYILGLLKKNNMNISHAAREADIDRKYFRKLMKKYGIDASDYTE